MNRSLIYTLLFMRPGQGSSKLQGEAKGNGALGARTGAAAWTARPRRRRRRGRAVTRSRSSASTAPSWRAR